MFHREETIYAVVMKYHSDDFIMLKMLIDNTTQLLFYFGLIRIITLYHMVKFLYNCVILKEKKYQLVCLLFSGRHRVSTIKIFGFFDCSFIENNPLKLFIS